MTTDEMIITLAKKMYFADPIKTGALPFVISAEAACRENSKNKLPRFRLDMLVANDADESIVYLAHMSAVTDILLGFSYDGYWNEQAGKILKLSKLSIQEFYTSERKILCLDKYGTFVRDSVIKSLTEGKNIAESVNAAKENIYGR